MNFNVGCDGLPEICSIKEASTSVLPKKPVRKLVSKRLNLKLSPVRHANMKKLEEPVLLMIHRMKCLTYGA